MIHLFISLYLFFSTFPRPFSRTPIRKPKKKSKTQSQGAASSPPPPPPARTSIVAVRVSGSRDRSSDPRPAAAYSPVRALACALPFRRPPPPSPYPRCRGLHLPELRRRRESSRYSHAPPLLFLFPLCGSEHPNPSNFVFQLQASRRV